MRRRFHSFHRFSRDCRGFTVVEMGFAVAVFSPDSEPGFWDVARDHYGSRVAAPVKDFVAVVDETLDAIKALPATDPSRELLIPGERGARTYAQRSSAGVPLGAKVWASLTGEAAKAGVPVPELP